MTAQLLDLGPSDVHIPGGSPGASRDYQPTRTPTDLSQLQPQVTPMSAVSAPKYSLGDRVEATVNHMPGMKGMTGAVAIANAGSPPYYGVKFDGTTKVHKWLAENELKPATAAAGVGREMSANPGATTMSELDAAKRKKIPNSQFADPAERKYPLPDKAHADNAAARLEQEKGSMSPGKYARIKSRIRAAQKRFGEGSKPKKSSLRGRGFTMEFSHPSGAQVRVRHMSAADADGLCFLPATPITLGDD